MRILALFLCLAACGDSNKPSRGKPEAPKSGWVIGPIIQGKNYSVGTPLQPAAEPDGFSIPIGPAQEPHYVTFTHGTLIGKTIIRMAYRVEGPLGVRIYGAGCSEQSPSAITLYFQRAGDDWHTDGNRWWATFASQPLAIPGTYAIEAPLDGRWTSVISENWESPSFASAKTEASQVGFTFSNCEGYGHGARATAPVKLVVTSFTVE